MSPANNPGVRKKQTTTTKIHTNTRSSPYTKILQNEPGSLAPAAHLVPHWPQLAALAGAWPLSCPACRRSGLASGAALTCIQLGHRAGLRSTSGRRFESKEQQPKGRAPTGLGMEVMAPATINALNGSSVKLSCTFNSCYKVENKQFSLNWTYQECSNCSEELFLQFRMKIMNKQLDRFGNRVEFTGNPTKYDVSFTLKNVQLEDEGTYNCYVLNPPDRQRGHASISLKVLTKEPPKHDSTVAVIVGASVGGFLAVVILVLMVVKCVRRKKQQRLNTDDQKTEEEGKTDGEGNPDEGTK
ncbi:sodium channel regulatory subunit beta-2 isoform 1-T1 [Theristicus caerulescens]